MKIGKWYVCLLVSRRPISRAKLDALKSGDAHLSYGRGKRPQIQIPRAPGTKAPLSLFDKAPGVTNE